MYRLCIFDLDGTLVNTIADIAFAVNRALRQMGFPEHEEDAYRQMVGNGMRMLCLRALPEDARDDPETVEKLIREYDTYYRAHCCDISRTYPGIPELLRDLKENGILCAVISNKPHPQTRIVLDTLFEEDAFFFAEGQSSRYAKKPEPEALLDCIKKSGVPASEAVYVGDSNVDVQFAKNAGIPCIGVSWGFRGEAELTDAGAACIAKRAGDILSACLDC